MLQAFLGHISFMLFFFLSFLSAFTSSNVSFSSSHLINSNKFLISIEFSNDDKFVEKFSISKQYLSVFFLLVFPARCEAKMKHAGSDRKEQDDKRT